MEGFLNNFSPNNHKPNTERNSHYRVYSTKYVLKKEISPELQSLINCDQFAYKEGISATDALIMCHHTWLTWLDNNADHVRVVSFDLKKTFDSVSHNNVCKKLEKTQD